MTKLILFILLSLPFCVAGQNIGIGVDSAKRARLEVHGVAGAGSTSAIFGGDRGISLQRNFAAIGFNQYRDDSLDGNGRYLGNGYAAVLSFTHNQPNLSQGLDLNLYPSGTTDAAVPAGFRVLRFTSNNRLSLMTDGGNALLDVGRGNGGEGTAMFMGTNYHSHFNYSTGENTYIRSGKGNHVIINDITGGKVVFGDGSARVGVNTASPVFPLEVRQVAGTGLRMANAPYANETWEWRVVGNPANFNLYHQGVLKNYLRPSDGALNSISDERLKSNIQSLPSILDKLLQLRPVSYEMIKDNPAHLRSIGFIAQEVAPLFPQLTFAGNPSQDMMALQYSGIGTLAIKGIQEEQQHINQLEQKTIAAEQRLAEIEKKIAALKSKNK